MGKWISRVFGLRSASGVVTREDMRVQRAARRWYGVRKGVVGPVPWEYVADDVADNYPGGMDKFRADALAL